MNIFYFHDLHATQKKCTKCKTRKDITFFGIETYKKKNERARRFRSWCKKCESDDAQPRVRKRREKLKKEGKYQKIRYNETLLYRERHREQYLKKAREYTRNRRLSEGKKPGPTWLKYRTEITPDGKRIDSEPIQELVQDFLDKTKFTVMELAITSGVDHTNITRLIEGEKSIISEQTIDKLLIAMNMQDAWHDLYPIEEGTDVHQ